MASSNSSMVMILAIVVIAGAIFWVATQDDTAPASIGGGVATTETGAQVADLGVDCPDDGTTDGQVRYRDNLAATNSYLAPTVYFSPLTDGQERVTAGALATDGTYSTAVDLKCVSSGTEWQPIAVAEKGTAHSVVGDTFIAEGSFVKKDLTGKAYGDLQFKVEDRVTGGAKFFNISGNAGTGYQTFNGSTMTIANGADTGSSLQIEADGFIDAIMYIKTNTTKKQFGEDGLRTFFLVDADGSAWDEPVVSIDNGPSLTNVITSMQSEDLRKYSGYEYAYEIGPVGDRESELKFFLQTASGVNATASDDPTIEFCSESRYNSNKEQDTILVGCWTDAATQVQVSTANRHLALFDVS